MHATRLLISPAAALLLGVSAPAAAPTHPLQFFVGRTEGSAIVRIILQKPFDPQSLLEAIEHALGATDGKYVEGDPS